MTTARDRPPEEAAEDTSFARGLRLLLTVADRGEVRADELSSLLEMPLSTVYRYLRTLGEFGFVERHGGQFRLGPELLIGSGANVTPTEEGVRAGLGGIVMTGTATSEGELIPGPVAMAAPLFREDGIVGAIGLIGPAFRCDEAWRGRAGRLLQEAAREVNAALAE